MRILFTNVGIANRTGTEIVVMDLARELAAEGHEPMIWAPVVNPAVAAPLVTAGIPVVSNFDDLPAAPDVIHGHHHLETLAALRRFPDVPAIFVCHSGHWWHDEPPRHPAIRQYVAVDEFCRQRLADVPWLAPDRIHVVRNAVDLQRFSRRDPLPSRPHRALVFSHYAGPGTHLEAIREACDGAGLDLEVAGSGVGAPTAEPERVLPAYDLVFAKARCALEAMATGCAVVLCDTTGLGSLVTRDRVQELRRWNFGFRVLDRPLRPHLIAEEIARYDSHDAGDVSTYLRETAGLDEAVRQYSALYRLARGTEPSSDDAADWNPTTARLQIEDQRGVEVTVVDAPQVVEAGRLFNVHVSLRNSSRQPIATSHPWPCQLMYRWLDPKSRAMVVEHGFRTAVSPPCRPGTTTRQIVRVFAPAQAGDYVLRVTMIQEGWRWLDALEPAVAAETTIFVKGSDPFSQSEPGLGRVVVEHPHGLE